MSATAIRAGRAFVELMTKNKMDRGLNSARRSLNKFAAFAGGLGAKLVAGGAAAGLAFMPAVNAASKLQETLNKFDVVFGENSEAMQKWGRDFGQQVGRSKRQVFDFLSSTGDLLIPLGFEPGAAESLSKDLTKLAIDLGSFNEKISDEKALEDLHAALTGSGEVMKKYGVVLDEAGTKQELLNMGLDPKNVTNAQKAQARLNIILRGTTAAQGDAIRSAGSYANMVKRLKGSWENFLAEVGTPLLDALSAIVGHASSFLNIAGSLISQNADLVKWIAGGAAVVVALGTALMAAGAAAFLVSSALGAVGTVIGVITSLVGFLLSPIGLVIAGVAALGVAILKWTTFGEETLSWFSARWSELSAFVMGIIGGIVDALKAGNLKLAAEIAWKGILLAFELGKAQVMRIWLEMGHLMATAFEQASAAVKGTFAQLITSMAQGYLRLKELITGENQAIAMQAVEIFGGAVQQGLKKELESNIKALNLAKSAAVAALDSAGNKTRQELKGLLTQAAKERKDAEQAKAAAQSAPAPPGLTGVPQSLGSVTGTFSAAGASLLAFAGAAQKDQNTSLLEAIRKNTAKQADEAADLNSKMESA